jgi:threonine 3-dehydrogenase
VTPGHEAAGVVVAAGPNTRIAPGTPSVILLMEFCGACRSCKLGLTNQCLDKRGGVGFTKDGGYGVYLLANEQTFFLVDPDIPATNVTMLLDVMGTTAHVIERAKLVHPTSNRCSSPALARWDWGCWRWQKSSAKSSRS